MSKLEQWVLEQPVWLHVVLVFFTGWLWAIVLVACKLREDAVYGKAVEQEQQKISAAKTAQLSAPEQKAKTKSVEVLPKEELLMPMHNESLLKQLNIIFGCQIFLFIITAFVGFYAGINIAFIMVLVALLALSMLFTYQLKYLDISEQELAEWNKHLRPNQQPVSAEQAKTMFGKLRYWSKALDLNFPPKKVADVSDAQPQPEVKAVPEVKAEPEAEAITPQPETTTAETDNNQ